MNEAPRYQIFVSSTFSDLVDQRKAAIEAIYEAGHIPIALENFPPTTKANVDVIRQAMSQCQIFVMILGHRYGQIVPGEVRSYTEYEYDLAQEYRLHTLIFALEEPLAEERRRELDESKNSERREKEHFGRLSDFIGKARNHFLTYWRPDNFKYKVGIALAKELLNCQLAGFILQPEDPTIFDTKSEFIFDIVNKLRGFTKLYDRCNKNPEVKRELAEFFVEQYMDTISRNQVNLFFESGSTIAFLVKRMAGRLQNAVAIRDGVPNISITTNNVLAYLLLWLSARIPCSQFPWSPPFEETYGALYAGIANLIDKHPDYRQPPMDQYALAEIEKLVSSHFAPRYDPSRVTLLFGTASGLQITKPRAIHYHPDLPDNRREELKNQIESCFGPHVGSYHNKVFKRFMYATKLPMVLLLDSEKINCPVEAGKCHYILDSEFTWDAFLKDYPLAICVGCAETSSEDVMTRVEIGDYFRQRGFSILDESGATGVGSFIARNEAFIRQFEARCDVVTANRRAGPDAGRSVEPAR